MNGRQKLLGISEAAELLGVSPDSLRKWSDQGLVPFYRTPGRQRRYSAADLQRFQESMREPRTGSRKADAPRRGRRWGSGS